MRIGIDATFLTRDRRGMGRYVRALLDQLIGPDPCDEARGHHFLLLGSGGSGEEDQMRSIFPDSGWTYLTPKSRVEADTFFFPWARIDIEPQCRRIVTIHDVAPFYFQGDYWGAARDNRKDRERLRKAARLSNAVITVSESSRRDIAKYLGVPAERIHVTYEAASSRFRPVDAGSAEYGGAPFMLFVGSPEKRKNLQRLLEAMAILKKRRALARRLVMVGERPASKSGLMKFLIREGLEKDVIFHGEASDNTLVDLYNGASVFVFPSLYEGFGLPLLEAMACGTPCAAARASSLPEIGGDAVEYFDPLDASDLADALYRVISSPERARDLAQKGAARASVFSWRRCADETMRVLAGSKI
jgi:glycosyltransferase involved in cell wall biosynthesis